MKLFVYGTLRRGEYNHYLVEDSRYLGRHVVRGRLYSSGPNGVGVAFFHPEHSLLPGPMSVAAAERAERFSSKPEGVNFDASLVVGEVYDVTDDETLRRIDRLEGYTGNGDSIYRRVLTLTTGGDAVWVYARTGAPQFRVGSPGEIVAF